MFFFQEIVVSAAYFQVHASLALEFHQGHAHSKDPVIQLVAVQLPQARHQGREFRDTSVFIDCGWWLVCIYTQKPHTFIQIYTVHIHVHLCLLTYICKNA